MTCTLWSLRPIHKLFPCDFIDQNGQKSITVIVVNQSPNKSLEYMNSIIQCSCMSPQVWCTCAQLAFTSPDGDGRQWFWTLPNITDPDEIRPRKMIPMAEVLSGRHQGTTVQGHIGVSRHKGTSIRDTSRDADWKCHFQVVHNKKPPPAWGTAFVANAKDCCTPCKASCCICKQRVPKRFVESAIVQFSDNSE